MQRSYFAGANTVNGFVSYYGQIFGEIERTYIIKGGSGTGKSRLMKEIADAAESKGREVEYFYCSFDPSSVDGIIVDGSLAVIDGTAPHIYEPSLPGVRENLIDLGAFWDEKILACRGDEIRTLLRRKKKCFDMAYSYLSAVKGLDRAKENIVGKYIKRDKISVVAANILSKSKPVKSGKDCVRLVSALGKNGRTRFDTFENIASEKVNICDTVGAGYVFLEEIRNESRRRGIPVAVSYDPLFEGRIDALLLGGSVAVSLSPNGETFIEEEILENEREELRSLDGHISLFESKAEDYLKKAAEIHFNIESIYVSAMDFERKEKFTKKFIETHI